MLRKIVKEKMNFCLVIKVT